MLAFAARRRQDWQYCFSNVELVCFFIPLGRMTSLMRLPLSHFPSIFHFQLFIVPLHRMIGIFDSGFGGLTILQSIRKQLPQYDYLYLGDNARTPYGTRSFEVVYEYTWECVNYLFSQGCNLVILACNTASAKALRTIQQRNLPLLWKEKNNPDMRVLGVIRPTVECVATSDSLGSWLLHPDSTRKRHIGIFATAGTVASASYPIEIAKIDPTILVSQQACPMWVPLIEAGEHTSEGADYFVQKYIDSLLAQDPKIDTIILGCTHYPLLMDKLRKYTPQHIQLLAQGDIVAASLQDYLTRHSTLEQTLSKQGTCRFLTTESADKFTSAARIFLGEDEIPAQHIVI